MVFLWLVIFLRMWGWLFCECFVLFHSLLLCGGVWWNTKAHHKDGYHIVL